MIFLYLTKKTPGFRDFSFYLFSTFVYEPIKISMNTNNIKTQFLFVKWSMTSKVILKFQNYLFLQYICCLTPNIFKTFKNVNIMRKFCDFFTSKTFWRSYGQLLSLFLYILQLWLFLIYPFDIVVFLIWICLNKCVFYFTCVFFLSYFTITRCIS